MLGRGELDVLAEGLDLTDESDRVELHHRVLAAEASAHARQVDFRQRGTDYLASFALALAPLDSPLVEVKPAAHDHAPVGCCRRRSACPADPWRA